MYSDSISVSVRCDDNNFEYTVESGNGSVELGENNFGDISTNNDDSFDYNVVWKDHDYVIKYP